MPDDPIRPGHGPAGASLSDILTVARNVAQGVNLVAQTYLNVQGVINQAGITAPTLVKPAPGRICQVVVVVAGSGNGAVYDATSASATTNQVYTITQVVGSYTVNMPCSFGIVVAPGTGQTIAVSFS